MTLGKTLGALRENKGYTQRELAKILNISKSAIAMYETDKREPDNATLGRIADFFGVSFNDLLGHPDKPTPTTKEPKMPKDLKKILEQQEIMFSGTPLDEEDKQEILDIIQYHLYKRAKELNKRKPKGGKAGE